MNSFLKSGTFLKMNFFLDIFQRLCLKVSEDFFHRTPPCIFVVIVNKLCTVFLRYPELKEKVRNFKKTVNLLLMLLIICNLVRELSFLS